MNLISRIFAWLLLNTVLCISCSSFDKETTQIRVHYFSKADTAFLFPDKYRDTGYRNRDFDRESKWLAYFDEKKLFDKDSLQQYMRLSYWRSFDDPVLLRLEQNKVVIKTTGWEGFETRRDSTALTIDEWGLLKAYHYYSEYTDSTEIRKQLLTRFPDIKNNREKLMHLEFTKS